MYSTYVAAAARRNGNASSNLRADNKAARAAHPEGEQDETGWFRYWLSEVVPDAVPNIVQRRQVRGDDDLLRADRYAVEEHGVRVRAAGIAKSLTGAAEKLLATVFFISPVIGDFMAILIIVDIGCLND